MGWVMLWNINWKYFFSLLYTILRAIAGLLFSNVFQSSTFGGQFILSQLYLFKNGMFETLSGCDLISSKFNATVAAYWKHLHLLLLFSFLSSLENQDINHYI